MTQTTVRSTKQKKLVLDYLETHRGTHLAAEDLVEGLAAQKTPIGKATAYRHLKQLEADGLVRRYSLAGDAKACYEYVSPDSTCPTHYHLLCEACGGVTHFECPEIKELCRHVEGAQGFRIDTTKLVFYGRCQACSK